MTRKNAQVEYEYEFVSVLGLFFRRSFFLFIILSFSHARQLTHSFTLSFARSLACIFLLSLDSSVSSASSNGKVEPGKKSLCSTIKVRDEKVKTLAVERKNGQSTTSLKGTYSTCFQDKQFVPIEL